MKRSAWLLCVLLAAGTARAGTELTIETRKAGAEASAKPQRGVVEIEGRRLRAEGGNGRHGAIWRGEEGVLQILDHREKSVFRIDRATAREVAGAREGIREGVAGLPDAPREAIERWVGGEPPARVELRPSGKSGEVSGVACRLLEAFRNGVRLAEVCEGPRGAAGVPPEALATARELAKFIAEVGDLLPPSMSAEGLDALVLVERVEGVPLRVRAWPKGQPATETRLVGAAPKRFAADRFQPPAGYEPGVGIRIGEPAPPPP